MKTRLLDLLLKTKHEVKIFRALTDKEIVLLIAEKELTGELVSWIARPAANAGRPTPRSA
ncbi:MAG: hypothetical protein EBR09_16640 [Proteobacteria bacterium]|nr:hypothetical protein [Pseudomonadota bacterium]